MRKRRHLEENGSYLKTEKKHFSFIEHEWGKFIVRRPTNYLKYKRLSLCSLNLLFSKILIGDLSFKCEELFFVDPFSSTRILWTRNILLCQQYQLLTELVVVECVKIIPLPK